MHSTGARRTTGKMPGVTTDKEWKFNENDDENLQPSNFQYLPNVIVIPNTYLYQMINFEDMKKARDTYGVGQKECDTHFHLHL